MLQEYTVPQLPEGIIYQQDGLPLILPMMVKHSWIAISLQDELGEDKYSLHDLLPRSPEPTPPDFFPVAVLLNTGCKLHLCIIQKTYTTEFVPQQRHDTTNASHNELV